MDKHQFYDNDWMLNRRGIESVFGFSYPLKDFGAEGEVKAWFLGYLHGLNEKKRYNPFGKNSWEETQKDAYERGFFHGFSYTRTRKELADLIEHMEDA